MTIKLKPRPKRKQPKINLAKEITEFIRARTMGNVRAQIDIWTQVYGQVKAYNPKKTAIECMLKTRSLLLTGDYRGQPTLEV